MFERRMRHSTEQKAGHRDFYKGIDADSFLAPHFQPKATTKKRPPLNTDILQKWLELEVNRDPGTYGVQIARCKLIGKLKQIRNKSIMAHGYEGVSRTTLEASLHPQSIKEFVDNDMRDYLAHPQIGAAVSDHDDPLCTVVPWLEKALEA
jgi:hypothetical protein